jgi:hypothetical protein
MPARLIPQSSFWRIAIVALWIVAVIAGVASTARYVRVCELDKGTQEETCGVRHVGSLLLLKAKNTLSDWEPILLGLGTIAIAAFTWRLWLATTALWHHTRVVERAYVKMSHLPPGVTFHDGGKAKVTIQVINRGRTPAYVTDVRLSPIVLSKTENLPERARYTPPEGQSAQAFLVASDHIFIEMDFWVQDLAAVLSGTKSLYFVGYVDYVDAFKQRHRGGYARLYNLHDKTNNLVFVTSSAYNYDRLRPQDVGTDWADDYA